MRLTKKHIRDLIKEEINLLVEEEEEEEGGEEENPFGEGGDEGGEGDAEEAGGDEDEEGDAEEGTEEEAEEEVEVTPEEEIVLGKSADDQIQNFLVDIETTALKSASLVQREDPLAVEWHNMPLSKLLFEELAEETPSPELDLEVFAAEVARLIQNYDSLLDMEALIVNKAKSFLRDKYDDVTADHFEELLDLRFSITTRHPAEDDSDEFEAPMGLGALAPAGGA